MNIEAMKIVRDNLKMGHVLSFAEMMIIQQAIDAAMQGKAEPVTTAYNLPVNTPCKDAPEHIWLQTAGVWPEDGEFSELTWCSDNQHQDDTLYVRADVVTGNSPVIPDGLVACSERMPETRDWVIAHDEVGTVKAYICEHSGEWIRDNGDELYAVTHWQPLPAAPRQESE